MKLYVGNLPYSLNDEGLANMFANYGPITSAVVIINRLNGRSKGFGFVELDDAMGEKALAELNGKEVEGRALTISVARPKREDDRSGGYRN